MIIDPSKGVQKLSDQRLALEELAQAAQWRREADDAYKIGLETCAELGIGNSEMSRATGNTEASIRMMRKRLGIVPVRPKRVRD